MEEQKIEQEQPKKRRISNNLAFIMIFTAILLDLVSLVAGLNVAVDLIATPVFAIWFHFIGVTFTTAKNITYLASFTAEAIPFLSFLPGITTSVIVTIVLTNIEDGFGIKIPKLTKPKVIPKPIPINK